MSEGYRQLDCEVLPDTLSSRRGTARQILVGLLQKPKSLPQELHWDAQGSILFDAMCDDVDYYPTACEFEVLRRHAKDIVSRFEQNTLDVIDLGAGDGRKSAVLVGALLEQGAPVRYVPIDISEEAVKTSVKAMVERFPGLPTEGLVGEYFDALRWLGQTKTPHLVLFLGSTIGGFDHLQTKDFLCQLADSLAEGDHVLVGFDLKKEIEPMRLAYQDRSDINARFNYNVLHRLNREFGANFDVSKFQFYATYNIIVGRMEMYLVSTARQSVTIGALQRQFEFDAWECIYMGRSYKYLVEDISEFARFAGFAEEASFYDEKRWYCNALWKRSKR